MLCSALLLHFIRRTLLSILNPLKDKNTSLTAPFELDRIPLQACLEVHG